MDHYYPQKLKQQFFVTPDRKNILPFPFTIDTKTYFIYKYNELDETFNFYTRLPRLNIDMDGFPVIIQDNFTIPNLLQPCLLNDNDEILLNMVPLYTIPVSENRQPPEKPKMIDSFTLTKKVKSKFYRLENMDTCCICLENKILYYNINCQRPHPCCMDCWKRNNQTTCPTCRKNIYS